MRFWELLFFIQNAVSFFKLISFTNAAICNCRILKSKRMIYECGYLNCPILKSNIMIYECKIAAFVNQRAWFKNAVIINSRILKSFFTLVLKRVTYTFILSFFLASSFLFVSALVFLSSSVSFIVFSYHCKFILIRSLSSSPVVYKKKFILLICLFSCKGFSDASFSLLFLFSSFLSFSTSLHCLLCAFVSSFRVLFLLQHWFIYIFPFLLSICFLVLTKVTSTSLPAVWVFVMPYLLCCCCCHRYCCRRI